MVRTAGKSSFFRRRATRRPLFTRRRACVLSRQLSANMKTTGHATLPSRISRPPVPLELFLIVTKPVAVNRDNQPSSLLPAYNNHGALTTCPSSPTTAPIYTAPVVAQNRTAASLWRAITKYPPCRRWRLLRPRGRCGNRSDCTGHRQQPLKHANT